MERGLGWWYQFVSHRIIGVIDAVGVMRLSMERVYLEEDEFKQFSEF